MSTGAYAFLFFGDTEQLLPAIDAVRGMPQTQSWHAVDGHYHLAVALSDNTVRDQLADLPGVQNMLYCEVDNEIRGGFTVEAEPTYAWLTMEVDSEKAAEVQEALKALPENSFPALAFGDCGAVAAIKGATFEVVDKMVESAVRPLDGMLRVKRDWIIDLTQL
ncbi:hypothetical protein KQI65_03130 [bacterium]|nr:hypothetical protein [bacterium]